MVAKRTMSIKVGRIEAHSLETQQADEVFKLCKCLFIEGW